MNELKVYPNHVEIHILVKLIILYPIFYPEIEVFLRTCDLDKEDNVNPLNSIKRSSYQDTFDKLSAKSII
jgi:hypothetical protein